MMLGDWKQTIKILSGISFANAIVFFAFHWALGGLLVYPSAFKNSWVWLSFLFTTLLVLMYLLVNSAMSVWAMSLWTGKSPGLNPLRGAIDACIRILVLVVPAFALMLIAWLTSAFGSGHNAGIFTFPVWLNNAKSPPETRIGMILDFVIPVTVLVSIRICTMLPRIAMGESGLPALRNAWSDANGRFFLYLSCFAPLALTGWFVSGNLMNVMYVNIVVFSAFVMLASVLNLSLHIDLTEA